jgi:predicted Rossmann-fold nucleotide-binding protein
MTERAVAVFGSSGTVIDSPDWPEAVAVGEALARAGFAVVIGGYGGTIRAARAGQQAGDTSLHFSAVEVAHFQE